LLNGDWLLGSAAKLIANISCWLIRWSRVTGYDMTQYMVGQWKLDVTQSALDTVAAMKLPAWMPLAMKFQSLKVPVGTSRKLDLKRAGMALNGEAKFISVSQPQHGTLVLGEDDVYTYRTSIAAITNDKFEVVYESSAGNRQTLKFAVQVIEPQSLLMERFDGIDGTTIKSLTDSDSYPNFPTATDYLVDFKSPGNAGDSYGLRVSGYLSVPISGEYRLYIASDDESELRLSTTELPQDAAKIAGLKGWTNPENYTSNASQTSPAILLQAGKFYYVEALMKEGAGGDHLSVAWTGPGVTVPETITGNYLIPYGVDIAPFIPPSDFGDAIIAYPVTFAQNGARHQVGPLFLGSNVDAEVNGKASIGGDGDSGDDGFVFNSTLLSTDVATTSSLTVIASAPGKLDAWIDFNKDGDWLDPAEQIFSSKDVVEGANVLAFEVPTGSASGNPVARFRLSSLGNLAPTGVANDGEVEDYLAAIVTGAASAIVDIRTPKGGSEVTVDGADLVVRQGLTIVFKAPFNSFGDVTFSGASLDDLLLLTNLEAMGNKSLLFDGGLGADVLKWAESGKTLDLTNPNIRLLDIESIDITGTGDNKLLISAEKVKSASTTTDTLKVVSDAGDTISFGIGWKVETPTFIDGQFTHIISEVASGGTARVELRNGNAMQNPLNPFDADRDGKFVPLDALRIINELRRRGSGAFTLPTKDSEIGKLYFDVNGDNRLTALDALRIINAIARANRSGIAVGESASPSVDLSSILTKEKIDGKQHVSTALVAMVSPLIPRSNELRISSHELVVDQVLQTFGSDEEEENTGMSDLRVSTKYTASGQDMSLVE